MKINWTSKALSDVTRLYEFLQSVNQPAAVRVVQSLTQAPDKILEHPRLGIKLEEFEKREVRQLFIGDYEMRYEILTGDIFILRIWHVREDR
jgi:plasmid stabilization system protein ParE